MFKNIFTALTLCVICTSSITASASQGGTTTDYSQNLQVYIADGINKTYTIQGANLSNPFKLAKQVGFAIATQNGGFTCHSERNKPKKEQVCSGLVLHTDIPTNTNGSINYFEDCAFSWKTWSWRCSYSMYIHDIGNF